MKRSPSLRSAISHMLAAISHLGGAISELVAPVARLLPPPARRGAPAAALVGVVALVVGCANPGAGPDGGPYDETPPRIVRTQPALGALNAHNRRVSLTFDEYVQLENANEKIIVSPPQIETPDIKAAGKRVLVTLNDTLKPSTTYTIDFSDAIVDSNEGNPLGNYTFYFSTGSQIDTMQVSGHVLNASDLEPVKGMLVGLQSKLADSCFRTRPFDRVGRTDGSGHFVIKGVAPGAYRVYALKDMDGTFTFSQKSEAIAFLRDTIRPSMEPAVRYDTIWHDSLHIDSIRTVDYTRFRPDNLVLLSFVEAGQPRYLLKSERLTPGLASIYFTAPSKSRPEARGLNFDMRGVLEDYSINNDTLRYWVADTALLAIDTLRMALRYDAYDDSTGQLAWRTDTLELTARQTRAAQREKLQEAIERWEKDRQRALRRGRTFEAERPAEWLKLTCRISSSMAPTSNPQISVDEPLSRIDTARIRLLLGPDSAAVSREFLIEEVPGQILVRNVLGEWRPGQQYRLEIDSAAFVSLTGRVNKAYTARFAIAAPDTYGSIFFNLQGVDSALVQIFTDEKRIYRQVKSRNGHADFFYVAPGTYYVRAIVDLNGNGKWDTGDYDAGRQPEPVYYYPGALQLRAGWDIDQDWNVTATPLIRQKPLEITKQKADQKKTVKSRNLERLRQLGRR